MATYTSLTDATSVDLPTINIPLGTALGGKLSTITYPLIAAKSRPLGLVDVGSADSVPAAVVNTGSPVAGCGPVPQTDTGTAVADGLNAWTLRCAFNRGFTIGVSVAFQTKSAVFVGNDTAITGVYGGAFGSSGGFTVQGDYPAIASTRYNGGGDAIRCLISGISINPLLANGGGNYAIDLWRQYFTELKNVVIDPAKSGANLYRGLRIQDSDSIRIYDMRATNCQGQMMHLGPAATNISFFGGNFENGNGSVAATIASQITAYTQATSPTGSFSAATSPTTAFAKQMQITFYGTQFERFGTLVVNAGSINFDAVSISATTLVLGPRANLCRLQNIVGLDGTVYVLSPSNTIQDIDALNFFVRGKKTLGENSAMSHTNGSDQLFLPGGVEWFLWPEVYAPNISPITVGAGPNAGNSTMFSAEAARVEIRSASGSTLEISPNYDLRKAGVGTGTTARDGFSFMTLRQSSDAKLVLVPTATTGAAACIPNVWRNRLSNGRLLGSVNASATPPTNWVNGGITFSDGSPGWLALASGGTSSMEQVVAMRPGHTYMAVARVKTSGALNLAFGRVANGGDGRRHVFCGKNGNVDPGFGDGSTILQCFVTCGSRSETAFVSLGGTAALGGPGIDEIKWIALIDLDETAALYSAGPPTTGVFEMGDTVTEIAPAAMGFSSWQCVARGAPGTWVGFNTVDQIQNVAYAATRSTDFRAGVRIVVGALTGAIFISVPSTTGIAARVGDRLVYEFTQDSATGSRNVTFAGGAGGFKTSGVTGTFTGGAASTKANIAFRYDGTNWIQSGAGLIWVA